MLITPITVLALLAVVGQSSKKKRKSLPTPKTFTTISNWDDCQFTFVDRNGIYVEYDLAVFERETYPFEIEDSLGKNWVYFVNICKEISQKFWLNQVEDHTNEFDEDNIPPRCYNHTRPPCVNTTDSGECTLYANTTGQRPFAAMVNIDNRDDGKERRCHWLGADLSKSSYSDTFPNFNVSLLNEYDSSQGIMIEYLNGDWCNHGSVNRAIQIQLVCPDTGRFSVYREDELIIEDEEVDQIEKCVWQLQYESALACPSQCISSEKSEDGSSSTLYSVCNARGICATDPNAKAVRCLCDDGYNGVRCKNRYSNSHTVHEKHTGMLTVLVICIVLLVAVLSLSVYLCYRIKMNERSTQGALDKHIMRPMLNDTDDALNASAMGVSMDQTSDALVSALNRQASLDESDPEEEHPQPGQTREVPLNEEEEYQQSGTVDDATVATATGE